MEPYQEAAEATRRSGEIPLNTLKYAGGAILGTAGLGIAGKVINKILPLLSPLVPESFAKKALGKIDPRLGAFISKAESEGTDFPETRDFLQKKVDDTLAQQSAQENKNIIQKYSPELHDFMKDALGKGTGLITAATQANTNAKFRPIIEKITKENKTSWPELVDLIYGSVGEGEKENERVNALKKFNENKKGRLQQEIARFESGYGSIDTPETQQQQPGQGQTGTGWEPFYNEMTKLLNS